MKLMMWLGIILALGAGAALFTGCDGAAADPAARYAEIDSVTHHSPPEAATALDIEMRPAHLRMELVGAQAVAEPEGFMILPWVHAGGTWLALNPPFRMNLDDRVERDVPAGDGLYFEVLALVGEGTLLFAVSP